MSDGFWDGMHTGGRTAKAIEAGKKKSKSKSLGSKAQPTKKPKAKGKKSNKGIPEDDKRVYYFLYDMGKHAPVEGHAFKGGRKSKPAPMAAARKAGQVYWNRKDDGKSITVHIQRKTKDHPDSKKKTKGKIYSYKIVYGYGTPNAFMKKYANGGKIVVCKSIERINKKK